MDNMAKKALSLNGKHYLIGRDYVGKSAAVLGKAIGLNVKESVPFLFGETTSDHPWVVAEQMTCILPVIKVRDFNDGLTKCLRAEHGFGHTSSVFTQDMQRASLFSQKMNTTVVVVNGGTLRGNGGNGGESFFSHTIASPTGQGITTPRDFSRKRRIMTNNMRFI